MTQIELIQVARLAKILDSDVPTMLRALGFSTSAKWGIYQDNPNGDNDVIFVGEDPQWILELPTMVGIYFDLRQAREIRYITQQKWFKNGCNTVEEWLARSN